METSEDRYALWLERNIALEFTKEPGTKETDIFLFAIKCAKELFESQILKKGICLTSCPEERSEGPKEQIAQHFSDKGPSGREILITDLVSIGYLGELEGDKKVHRAIGKAYTAWEVDIKDREGTNHSTTYTLIKYSDDLFSLQINENLSLHFYANGMPKEDIFAFSIKLAQIWSRFQEMEALKNIRLGINYNFWES
jgi:hypothetical protein